MIRVHLKGNSRGILGDGPAAVALHEHGYWIEGKWMDGRVIFSVDVLRGSNHGRQTFNEIDPGYGRSLFDVILDHIPSARLISSSRFSTVSYAVIDDNDYIFLKMLCE